MSRFPRHEWSTQAKYLAIYAAGATPVSDRSADFSLAAVELFASAMTVLWGLATWIGANLGCLPAAAMDAIERQRFGTTRLHVVEAAASVGIALPIVWIASSIGFYCVRRASRRDSKDVRASA
jgi:hypothetical protein